MKARLLVALLFAAVAIAAPAARPCPVCAGDGIGPDALVKGAGEMPDDVLAVTVEIVGIAVAVCAAILTVVIPLGALEGQLGAWFSIPGLQASVPGRIVMATLTLLVAVSAIPITEALAEIMTP